MLERMVLALPVLAGLLLAGLTLWAFSSLRLSERRWPYAALLAAIAAAYLLFAAYDGRTTAWQIEFAGLVVFFGLALAGLRRRALLTLGFLLHGGWDVLHHFLPAAAHAPGWYAPFCGAYDLMIAAYLWWKPLQARL